MTVLDIANRHAVNVSKQHIILRMVNEHRQTIILQTAGGKYNLGQWIWKQVNNSRMKCKEYIDLEYSITCKQSGRD